MTTIRELFVKLGVKTDQKALSDFDKGLADVKKGALGLSKALIGVSGVLAGVGFGLWKNIQATANAGDAAANTASKYGITAEALQELDYAANRSGTTIDAVGNGLRRIGQAAADAAKGGNDNAEMFKKLGVNAKDASGNLRASDALMEDVAEQISKMKNPTEQLNTAIQLFGRSGTNLMPMLKEGRSGIKNLREEARALGAVISNDAAASFGQFNNNLLYSKKHIDSVRTRLAVGLLPKANELVERFNDWSKANKALINTKIDAFVERVSGFIDQLLVSVEKTNAQVQKWGGWSKLFERIGRALAVVGFLKMAGHVGTVVIGLKNLLSILKVVRVAMLVAFIKPLLIAAAVAIAILAIGLAVEDLIVFIRGGDSALGRFLDRFDAAGEFLTLLRKMGEAFQAFGGVVVTFGGILIKFWSFVFKVWWKVASTFWTALASVVFWWWKAVVWPVLGLMLDVFTVVFGKIETVIDGVSGKVQALAEFLKSVLGGLKKVGSIAANLPGAKYSPIGMAAGAFKKARGVFAPSSENNPRTPANNAQTNVNSGTTNITVTAETNASPEQIANATATKVDEATARWMRQTQASFAGGEM